MEIRPTTREDLPAQYEVFRAAIGELFHRHSFSPPDPPRDVYIAHQAHLLAHDAERCFVAEADGRVVGFTAALVRDDAWFLSSLFVLPEFQGRGVGRRLLERAWGGPFGRRLTITDAIQPISNGLYARVGLIPTTPLLHLGGEPRADVPAGLEAAEPEADALAELDRVAYGFRRVPDHSYWSARARATLWLRGGEAVAYTYAWPQGRIGPVAGRDGASAAGALRAELARRPGERAAVVVPGTAAELIEAGLAAGLRFTDPPGLLLLSREAQPPRALALSSYTLF